MDIGFLAIATPLLVGSHRRLYPASPQSISVKVTARFGHLHKVGTFDRNGW
jgi:hypothetical protein